jgi:outer membrane protein assembly factor BamB
MMRNYGYTSGGMLDLTGWDEDVVIPYGRALVLMASDHDRLLALDRRTGAILWESPRTPFDHPAEYCLGTVDGALFVGGRNVIRRYDINSGLLKWEAVVEDSFGRAALTEDSIYVPVKASIWKLDLEKGQVQGKVGVSLSTDDMVGNVYSDGERLWVHGGNRVYALTNLEHRLALLEKRIADGDPAALLDRMRLWAKGGETRNAIVDLEQAHDLIARKQGRPEADSALLDAMREIDLATVAPRDVLRLAATRLAAVGDGSTSASKDLLTSRRQALATALAKVRSGKIAATAEVLNVTAQLDDDNLLNSARRALAESAVAADVAKLKAAVLGDEDAARIIGADALARLAADEARPALNTMLDDADLRLKLTGARALANLGDRASLAPLVELMKAEELPIRSQASQVLVSLTGERFGYVAYDKPEARQQALDQWQAWLDAKGETAALKFPVPEVPPMLGRTIVTSYQQNVAIEFDAEGKEVWRLQRGEQPWSCQGLPNGHRLISFYSNQKVIEFDAAGKEVWKKENLGGTIFGAQRLENGNTLIPISDTNRVVEFKPDGGIAWEQTIEGRPMDAKRLPNGNTLVCLANTNQVVEVDQKGEVVWRLSNMNGPIKAQRLENGNTLVVQMNSGGVVELSQDGTKVWSREGFSQPYDAQRLPSGNTLIIDNNGAYEFDPSGAEVWKHALNGGAGITRY